jgi:hypothetical protein
MAGRFEVLIVIVWVWSSNRRVFACRSEHASSRKPKYHMRVVVSSRLTMLECSPVVTELSNCKFPSSAWLWCSLPFQLWTLRVVQVYCLDVTFAILTNVLAAASYQAQQVQSGARNARDVGQADLTCSEVGKA